MKKILIIDDEPDIVKIIQKQFMASHYEVITALDGEEGLEKAEREKPDLIILDIMMPKMDGYTFTRELHTKISSGRVTTPIIVLTAKEKMQDLFEIEGVKEYIVKPFDPAELLEKVKKYIG